MARGLVEVETVEIMWAGVNTIQLYALFKMMLKEHSKLKHLYLSKLPTEKRTKKLNLSKKEDRDLVELFNESDSNFVFTGFDV